MVNVWLRERSVYIAGKHNSFYSPEKLTIRLFQRRTPEFQLSYPDTPDISIRHHGFPILSTCSARFSAPCVLSRPSSFNPGWIRWNRKKWCRGGWIWERVGPAARLGADPGELTVWPPLPHVLWSISVDERSGIASQKSSKTLSHVLRLRRSRS